MGFFFCLIRILNFRIEYIERGKGEGLRVRVCDTAIPLVKFTKAFSVESIFVMIFVWCDVSGRRRRLMEFGNYFAH